jgi:hypothetical protein
MNLTEFFQILWTGIVWQFWHLFGLPARRGRVMMTAKDDIKKGISISIPWWTLIQVTLLVLKYGGVFPKLPWWVVWFPSLVSAATLGIILLVLIGVGLVWLIAAMIERRW